ncbi:MAG TPA: cellulase family glycosylhydrolase [Nevskiaceae bacterium]|nr:cellulase family glycosylhydrolase [Nevskiaceae bacterium]
MRIRLAALLACTLVACSDNSVLNPPPSNPSPTAPKLHRDGRWIRDDAGRVVLLHGVNAVWKVAPYFPPDEAAGFTEADADYLAANGFNVVRLGVLFAGVMPQQDVIDPAYLENVDRVVQLLASRHIWVLLDFHQDMLNEKYQGEGFPAWAVDDGGFPINDANKGFPGNEFASVALNRAFDNLWANGGNVWDRYRDAWIAVASRWKDQDYLLGYDLFNEPWPGTQWPTCFEMDCTAFDQTLQTFFEEILSGVRSVDAEHFAFIEPQQLFDFGAPSSMTAIADPALGLSWHTYCSSTLFAPFGLPAGPDCTLLSVEQMTFDNAETQANALGATSLITEFGAGDDLDDITRVVSAADAQITGWTYWAYKGWSDPTGNPGGEGLFSDDADLTTEKPKDDLLIRPYAQRIAGTPTAMSFDIATATFTLDYDAADISAPTEIFLPTRHYPAGFNVNVTGGTPASQPGSQILQITNASDAGPVHVVVTPKPSPGAP